MKGKKNVFFLFIIIVVAFLAYFIYTSDNYSNESNSDREKRIITTDYKRLTDTIIKYIDTVFFAQYYVKPNKYQFNYLNGDIITGPFKLRDHQEETIFGEIKLIPVERIRHNKSENFIRYEILSNSKKRIILGLLVNQDSILSKYFDHIAVAKFQNDGKTISLGQDTSITKISEREYLLTMPN